MVDSMSADAIMTWRKTISSLSVWLLLVLLVLVVGCLLMPLPVGFGLGGRSCGGILGFIGPESLSTPFTLTPELEALEITRRVS